MVNVGWASIGFHASPSSSQHLLKSCQSPSPVSISDGEAGGDGVYRSKQANVEAASSRLVMFHACTSIRMSTSWL